MRKFIYLLAVCLFLLALTACSNDSGAGKTEPIDVKLTINPKKAEVNQPITFKASVTQGKEKVNDADEVKFEIWRSKSDHHETIIGLHPKNGVYTISKPFDQEGTYYIITHVTARSFHTMPLKEFVVGTPSEKEESPGAHSMDGMNMDHDDSNDGTTDK